MSRWSVGAVRPIKMSLRRSGANPAALALFAVATLFAAAAAGCDGGGLPRCVTIEPSCTPRYQPTFANVYNNTLRESCGSQSVACHSAAGRQGGLSLEGAEVAYQQLTGGGTQRVVAGDPACSEIVVRMHGTGESYLMPPGSPLPAADRCAIEQWIADGALLTPVTAASPSEDSP